MGMLLVRNARSHEYPDTQNLLGDFFLGKCLVAVAADYTDQLDAICTEERIDDVHSILRLAWDSPGHVLVANNLE